MISLNPYSRPIPSKTAEPGHKCFLIFEGTNTEPTYFKAFDKKQMRNNWILLEKTDKEKGYSALAKLIELADDFTKGSKNKCTYMMAYDRLSEALQTKGISKLSKESILKWFKGTHRKLFQNLSLGSEIDKDKLSAIFNAFENQQENLLDIAVDSKYLLSYSYPDYTKGIDEIYIVVDRDPQSGIADDAFLKIIQQALAKDYKILLSNPCFEFWLLLHHTSEFTEDEKRQLKAGLISGENQNVAFKLLKRKDPDYTKKLSNVEMYIAKVKNAIDNSKLYSVELEELVSNIGSNIGAFLEDNLLPSD